MRCLYCDEPISRYSLYSLLIEKDKLCLKCRKQMKLKIQEFKLNELECISFYEYDSLFKTILLQYKECYDEALAEVFLYKIDLLIGLMFMGYKLVYVPSSTSKLKSRGFEHLKLIFERMHFKEVDGLKMKKELVQEGKDLECRKKMQDNYYYEGEKIDKLLIVDDVCTSGSSLIGVYKAFKGKARVIKAVILARA